RLVGATNGFIRRPFLLQGAIKGMLGGLVAVGLSYGAYTLIYRWLIQAAFFSNVQALAIVGFGTLIGLFGSAASVGRHLRRVCARSRLCATTLRDVSVLRSLLDVFRLRPASPTLRPAITRQPATVRKHPPRAVRRRAGARAATHPGALALRRAREHRATEGDNQSHRERAGPPDLCAVGPDRPDHGRPAACPERPRREARRSGAAQERAHRRAGPLPGARARAADVAAGDAAQCARGTAAPVRARARREEPERPHRGARARAARGRGPRRRHRRRHHDSRPG